MSEPTRGTTPGAPARPTRGTTPGAPARPTPGTTPGAPAITRDEVAHLARLARLALSDAELDHFAGQLDQIIGAVARVQEVAAENIPPMTHAIPGLQNVFRDDVQEPCLTAEQALSGAPAAEHDRFRVPRILTEE